MRQIYCKIGLRSPVDMNLPVIKVLNALFLETQYLFRLGFAFFGGHSRSIHTQIHENFRWNHVNKRSIYTL